MTKTVQHISLKKSTIKDKAPLATDLVDGELAVNIAEDGEKIFLKNTANKIVGFSADGLLDKKYLSTTSGGTVSGDTEFKGDVKIVYPDSTSQTVSLREVMVDNEMAISAALNDLSAKVNDQKTDIDTIKAKECLPLSGGTINGGLIVSGNTEFKGDVKIVYPDSSSQTVSLREVMVDNEMTISAALNELNERIEDQKKTVDSNSTIIGNISTKVNELLPLSGGTVSGETTFTKDTTFDNIKLKYPKTDSEAVSLRDVMLENEKVTAAALNDLNERVNDHKSDIDAIKTKEYLPLSGGTITGTLNVDAYANFSGELHVNSEGGIVSSNLTTDTLTSDGSLKITSVESIQGAFYDEGAEVEVWTTDGNTKPLSDFLQTSGGTVSGITTFTNDVKIAYPDSGSTPVSLRKVMFDNEEVIAAALNDLNDKVANISIINAPLIIKDGNKKYNVNIAKGIELGLFTEIQ